MRWDLSRQSLVGLADDRVPGLMNLLRTTVHVDWRKALAHPDCLRRVFPLIDAPTSTAVDVGANTGAITRFLARHFARVHAVEAVPLLAARLKAAALPRVTVHAVAAGAEAGAATLRVPRTIGGHENFALSTLQPDNALDLQPKSGVVELSIEVRPLDDLLHDVPSVRFIKIDVEGFEAAVIAGAERIIERHRPVLMVEIGWMHNPRYAELIDGLAARGYRMLTLAGARAIEGSPDHIAAQPRHLDRGDAGTMSAHWDFLFVPSERQDVAAAALGGDP